LGLYAQDFHYSFEYDSNENDEKQEANKSVPAALCGTKGGSEFICDEEFDCVKSNINIKPLFVQEAKNRDGREEERRIQ